jgi:hypothetical protein
MIDLSSFAGMFPSLTSLFGQQGAASPLPKPDPVEDSSEDAVEQDCVELSDQARQPIQSNSSASTFDTPVDAPIAVAEDGTYAPARTAMQSFSMSASFSFNMSIQRQVTSVSHASREIERPQSGSEARLSALESRSLYYQSVMNESRSSLAGGFTEFRSVQTELFYSRTRELALSLPAGRAEQFDQTTARVSRSFELNISMDFSFLGQFTSQSNTISSLDDSLFGQYLDNTGGLSGQSAGALQSFFDDVDKILEESEAFVVSSLSSFFDQVADSSGLSSEETAMLEGMVMDEVASFFSEIDSFLSDSRSFLAGPAASELEAAPTEIEAAEASDPVVPIVAPATIETKEDPAAILA